MYQGQMASKRQCWIQTQSLGSQNWIVGDEGEDGIRQVSVCRDSGQPDKTKQKSLFWRRIDVERDRKPKYSSG